MVICFGNVLFTLSSMYRDLPGFAVLMSLDRSNWPRCLTLAWLVAWT